jgi:hypothetical protein
MGERQEVVFFMWGSYRQSLIGKQIFYLEQARKRLLSQFEDIEAESNRAADEWLEKHSQNFDPDRHDIGAQYEASYEAGIEHYQLLGDLRDQTRLSVVAGMFHDLEKQLRDWVAKEIRHFYGSDVAAAKIWKVSFSDIIDLLESFGWPIRSGLYFEKIDACRCVVNVYKHGNGGSLGELKKKYPYYIIDPVSVIDPLLTDTRYLDYTYVKVSDSQLQDFSDAIVKFWEDVPDRICAQDDTDVPDWFEKAIKRD